MHVTRAIEHRGGRVEQTPSLLDGHQTRPSFTMPAHPVALAPAIPALHNGEGLHGLGPGSALHHDAPAPATRSSPLGGLAPQIRFRFPAPGATLHPGFWLFGDVRGLDALRE